MTVLCGRMKKKKVLKVIARCEKRLCATLTVCDCVAQGRTKRYEDKKNVVSLVRIETPKSEIMEEPVQKEESKCPR